MQLEEAAGFSECGLSYYDSFLFLKAPSADLDYVVDFQHQVYGAMEAAVMKFIARQSLDDLSTLPGFCEEEMANLFRVETFIHLGAGGCRVFLDRPEARNTCLGTVLDFQAGSALS